MSASTVPPATAYVAPHVFGEIPTPPNYCYGYQTTVQSSCMQDGNTKLSCNYKPFTPPRNEQLSEQHTRSVTEAQSIADMMAQIQAKLKIMSENLSQALKRMKSTESKQPTASQPNHSTQGAMTMSGKMPIYDVYAEEENICSIGSCNVSDTNLVIQQDGEGKPEIEHTPKYLSNPSENEIPSQQPPMSAIATHQIQFETSESTPNSNVYEKEDIACLNIISDVLDFTLELQHQHDERACKCPILKAYVTDVTKSSNVSIEHSMSEYRLQWDPGATKLPIMFMTAAGATKLQCVDVYKSEMVQMLAVQFGARAPISESSIMYSYASCLGWTEVNVQHQRDPMLKVLVINERRKEWHPGEHTILSSVLNRDIVSLQYYTTHVLLVISCRESTKNCLADQKIIANASSKVAALTWYNSLPGTPFILLSSATYTWDPGVLSIIDMILGKYTVAYQVEFVQRTTKLSFFGMTDCMQYIVSNGMNHVLHATVLIMQRATHLSQGNYLCSLYCNSVLKTEYCQMRCLWEFSMKLATRLQWDPEVTVLLHSSRATYPMDSMLEETAVANPVHIIQTPFQLLIYIEQPVDLKQFWALMLLQSHSWYNTSVVFLQENSSRRKRYDNFIPSIKNSITNEQHLLQ